MRLILNQFGRRLTEKLEYREKQYKHRLLMMLDEFPSLGRLGFFETELAFMAGYGITCFMIAQSLNQIEKAYGQNNSILDNAHVRVTYGALDDRTAKRISDLLGQATEIRAQKNLAGGRLSPWLGHIMISEQESPRPLLTPGEVLQLPADEALVMVGNMPPYRGKKVMYYQDIRFKSRAWLLAPNSAEEQKKELVWPKGVPSEWFAIEHCHPVVADPPATESKEQRGGSAGGLAPATELHEKQMDLQSDVTRANELIFVIAEQERADEQEREREDDAQNANTQQQLVRARKLQSQGRVIEMGSPLGGGDLPL